VRCEIHQVVLSWPRAPVIFHEMTVPQSPVMLTLDLRVRVLTAPI
jgi:hypothetical protein